MIDQRSKPTDLCTKCGHERQLHNRRDFWCSWRGPGKLACKCMNPSFYKGDTPSADGV